MPAQVRADKRDAHNPGTGDMAEEEMDATKGKSDPRRPRRRHTADGARPRPMPEAGQATPFRLHHHGQAHVFEMLGYTRRTSKFIYPCLYCILNRYVI